MTTDTRWCEHDEVSVECLHCRLRVAEATNELLEIKLQRLLELVESAVVTFGYEAGPQTHYEGCDEVHPACRLVRSLQHLLQQENDDG